ncbi:hypothetical protein HK098_005470 [Nowakowskiella sp. JEL0407]|nr:hypothetical protein HK098_005470 [Nowakowskiella sp. JEL0407]
MIPLINTATSNVFSLWTSLQRKFVAFSSPAAQNLSTFFSLNYNYFNETIYGITHSKLITLNPDNSLYFNLLGISLSAEFIAFSIFLFTFLISCFVISSLYEYVRRLISKNSGLLISSAEDSDEPGNETLENLSETITTNTFPDTSLTDIFSKLSKVSPQILFDSVESTLRKPAPTTRSKSVAPAKSQSARSPSPNTTSTRHRRVSSVSIPKKSPPSSTPASPTRRTASPDKSAFSTIALRQHKLLAETAYKTISAALDLDPVDKSAAIELYRRGVRELKAALRITFPTTDERDKAETVNLKLRGNLKQIEERLRELTAVSTPKPTTPSSPSTSKPRPPPRKISTTPAVPPTPPKSEKTKVTIKGVDQALVDRILDEVVVNKPTVSWEDIVGLESAKKALREIVILPSLRPELFKGLRAPARGLLLFGPPGTGKTMLAKAVAKESNAVFFAISASSLTSKYVGEGEKLVRALFAMARHMQPAVIFIDEIDSILKERSESEHEASRRLKTEFLLQFDGVAGTSEDRVLVMGATNRPQELDEAALRRMVKRIYIPLPEVSTRTQLLQQLISGHSHCLTPSEIQRLVGLTEGYSASDITALAREASLGPIRALGENIVSTPENMITAIKFKDFASALQSIRPSVSKDSVKMYEDWKNKYGSGGM